MEGSLCPSEVSYFEQLMALAREVLEASEGQKGLLYRQTLHAAGSRAFLTFLSRM